MKYWEIIPDNLSKAGWSWGCISAVDSSGRTIFVADAHRDDGERFVDGQLRITSPHYTRGANTIGSVFGIHVLYAGSKANKRQMTLN